MKIHSAVTTCPREGVDYLPATLESLQNAGFNPCVVRDANREGSWPTLRKALQRLVAQSKMADDGLLVWQDDVICSANLREYLESTLWPSELSEIGVVSLFTPKPNCLRDGWFSSDELACFRPFGACALCFSVHGAMAILNHKEKAMRTGSDTTTGCLFRKLGLKWLMHGPSFVEHIGLHSSISPEIGLTDSRISGRWIDDAKTLSVRETISDAQ